MNYDKLEFVETVEELAAMHNLEVPYEAGSGPSQIERHQRQTLYQLMDGLNAFYQQSLKQPAADPARQYLKTRLKQTRSLRVSLLATPRPAGTTC
jgi:DNA primase